MDCSTTPWNDASVASTTNPPAGDPPPDAPPRRRGLLAPLGLGGDGREVDGPAKGHGGGRLSRGLAHGQRFCQTLGGPQEPFTATGTSLKPMTRAEPLPRGGSTSTTVSTVVTVADLVIFFSPDASAR